MKHIIIGTSGHIDHGKSTLIKALTGRSTDSLQEEIDRGISINLGFTYFDLPNDLRVGIIDVPGHERFIKNMLSGAAGIDLVLLVVAADEGMMPQTIEHLNILKYMKINKGLVVLTKIDQVDEEMLELAKMDVEDHLQGTFLEGAPIYPVDSMTRKGLDQLIQGLTELSQEVEEKDASLPARLNIDRVFSVKGHGTVVTGTLMEGTIQKDSQLIVYPAEKPVNIRSIQVHSQAVDQAYAGQRTAINLSNISPDQVHRGDVLAAPHSLEKSSMIDVALEIVPDTDFVLEHWVRLRLFHGAREIFCRAVPLEAETLAAGEKGFVQLRLEEPLYCKKGDVFVVRTYSPMTTIGGGLIIDTASKKHNLHDEEVLASLRVKEKGDLKDILYTHLEQNAAFYPELEELLTYAGESKAQVEEKLKELIAEGKAYQIRQFYTTEAQVQVLKDKMLALLEDFHRSKPLALGLSQEEVKNQVDKNLSSQAFNQVFNRFIEEGLIKRQEALIGLASHQVTLNPAQEEIKEKILAQLEEAAFNLLTKEALAQTSEEEAVLNYLLTDQVLLLEDRYISKELFQEAQARTRAFLQEHGKISLAEFRDLTASSRKNSLLILDAFDLLKFTKRQEDYRVLA